MTKLAQLLLSCLFLAACQGAPPPQPQTPRQSQTWAVFLGRIKQMDAEQLLLARESAVRQYTSQPSDSNRLRAGYVLSRAPASPQQLAQSLEILTEIPDGSDLAPMRDLLAGEIRKFMEVKEAESRILKLQAEDDNLQARLVMLQEQLDALKEQLDALKTIEADMVESQQQADEMQP